jgi:hypothetical protein
MTSKQTYAYLAGLIDGEGSFTLHHYINKKTGYSHGVRAMIQLCNTSYEVMAFSKYWFDKMTGMETCLFSTEKTINSKKIWRIKIADKTRIPKILKRIKPFLIIKKRQAELLYKFCLTGKYAKVKEYGVKNGLNPRIAWMVNEVKRLNRSGDYVTTNTQNTSIEVKIESDSQRNLGLSEVK